MAFKDTGWIELRPITLLYGRNSSGKSAVIRGLRLLKQSLEDSPLRDDILCFNRKDAMNGKIDLRDFETVLHWRNQFINLEEKVESSKITFAFRYKLSTLAQRLWTRITGERLADDRLSRLFIDLALEFGYDDERKVTKLTAMHIDCMSESDMQSEKNRISKNLLSAFRVGTPVDRSDPHNHRLNWEERWYWESDCDIGQPVESGSNKPKEEWVNAALSTTSGFLPILQTIRTSSTTQKLRLRKSDFELIESTLGQITIDVKMLLEGIDYIGPIRPKPERSYTFTAAQMLESRKQELSGWLAFLLASDNYSSAPGLASDKPVLPVADRDDRRQLLSSATTVDSNHTYTLTKWINKLQLGQRVYAERIVSEDKDHYEFQVLIQEGNEKAYNWVDVGYGVSQILPIIAACAYAKRGDLVIIEQPELHLHPEAQANLGDLFIETIAKIQKNGPDLMEKLERILSGVTLLIETHSEHLLLRLQRRVAETTAKRRNLNEENKVDENELLSCLVIKASGASEVVNMQIDQAGNILDSSTKFISFFANDLEEVSELTHARLLINKVRGE